MKPIILIATLLLATTCSGSHYGAISNQYHSQDHLGQYAYGYADPNSQKHESRSHDGVTRGSYSYVDANGHPQSVSYVADPHHGFNAVGTNFPKAPLPVHGHVPYVPHIYAAHIPYAYHSVALTHQGVPVDTPEVQHAKAAHAAAHAAALAGHHLHKRSLWGGAAPWGYPQHVPVIHNGVPVDTPEVQHAKAAHFAAHSQALALGGHHSGAPADTPEVSHAKAAHFAAHAAARSGHSVASHGYHVPIIHNGVPVDTPEVQHAKAAHYAALAQASAHAGHDDGSHYDGHYDHSYQHGHHGPIHIPVIHNGVPVETPEVQHAKAAHFAAVAAAGGAGHGYAHNDGHYYDDGQYHHHY